MAIYDFMIGPYVTCIKIGFSKIEDVFPDDLKQKVIKALEAEGLGPDGKPLPKEEKPVEDKKEDKEIGAETSPEEPKEEEPSNDPKGDAKEPEGEDKKESEEAKEAN